MSDHATRRSFLAAAGAAAVGLTAGARAQQRRRQRQGGDIRRPGGRRPVAIASSNGVGAVAAAYDRLRAGADPLDSVIAGVRLVENDPDDMSVGLGGLPNEDGIVELDSSVMHGPRHRAGAVAALRNIKNPSAVAREVARRTDHCLLVGEGALEFAKRLGFEEENLLTERARQAWLRWKATQNERDDWLDPEQFDLPTTERDERVRAEDVPFTYGTIHCSGVNAAGDIAGTTTTSGLSWKLPGRVGDSPIIGAGLYTDNAVGSAGATGRGEAVMQVCGARTAVMRMEMGDHPTDACLYVLDLIAKKTKSPRLLSDRGEPNFNVIIYATNKEGAYGSACMREGRQFAVCDEGGPRREDCAYLFPRR